MFYCLLLEIIMLKYKRQHILLLMKYHGYPHNVIRMYMATGPVNEIGSSSDKLGHSYRIHAKRHPVI